MISFFEDNSEFVFRRTTVKLARIRTALNKKTCPPVYQYYQRATEDIDKIIYHYHYSLLNENNLLVKNQLAAEYARLANNIELFICEPNKENSIPLSKTQLHSKAFTIKVVCRALTGLLWAAVLFTSAAALSCAGTLFVLQPVLSISLAVISTMVFFYAGAQLLHQVNQVNELVNANSHTTDYVPHVDIESLINNLEIAKTMEMDSQFTPPEESEYKKELRAWRRPQLTFSLPEESVESYVSSPNAS